MTDAESYMRQAIDKARAGILLGQSPFGAVIVGPRGVVAAAHNTVWRDLDPSAHAEVNAIRLAAKALGTIALHGHAMFTTCEPCPMCLSAVHWAKLDRVVYAATIEDAVAAGFTELQFAACELARLGGSPLRVELGPLREECRALFEEWKKAGLGKAY